MPTYFTTSENKSSALEIIDKLLLPREVYCIIHNESDQISLIISTSALLDEYLLKDKKYKQIELSKSEIIKIQSSNFLHIGNKELAFM